MTKNEFQKYLQNYFPGLSDTLFTDVVEQATLLSYPKGTQLIKAGRRHDYIYFLTKGSAKAYYLNDGREVCAWFVFENDLLATLPLFSNDPSLETIELLEDADVIRINIHRLLQLAESDLTVSRLVTRLLLEHAEFLESRLYQIQFKSAKTRYRQLLNAHPRIVQKISLTDIASFLGVSRETLSRIRAEL